MKTVYGEVCYSRRVYEKRQEEGKKEYVYLLDEAMHMDKIGLMFLVSAKNVLFFHMPRDILLSRRLRPMNIC